MKMKLNRTVFVCIILFLGIFGLYAATGDPSPLNNKLKEYEGQTFSMEFHKPAVNEFFFSTPEDTSVRFTDGVGLVFPLPDRNTGVNEGYPSRQAIGVTYKLDTPGTIQVWCSAKQDHSDSFRLRSEKDVGLNYQVGCAADLTTATGIVNKAYNAEKVFGDQDDQAAGTPVYSVTITKPMSQKKSVILSFAIRSPKKNATKHKWYAEGQYTGYLIMEYTATV